MSNPIDEVLAQLLGAVRDSVSREEYARLTDSVENLREQMSEIKLLEHRVKGNEARIDKLEKAREKGLEGRVEEARQEGVLAFQVGQLWRWALPLGGGVMGLLGFAKMMGWI